MFIDRKALVPETAMPVAEMRKNCLGCSDCKGACLELIQMRYLPEILAECREEKT